MTPFALLCAAVLLRGMLGLRLSGEGACVFPGMRASDWGCEWVLAGRVTGWTVSVKVRWGSTGQRFTHRDRFRWSLIIQKKVLRDSDRLQG